MSQEVQEHQQLAARIEALIEEVTTFADPHARTTAQELVQALLDMYGEGLNRLLEITMESKVSGLTLIDTFASDDLLSSLFLLHGLHPLDIETRILQALDEVRPYLQSHGGNVEFVKVEGGTAYLRLQGSCHGCPGSTSTLKLAIEEAIYKAAPDLDGLQVEGVTDPPSRQSLPVTFVRPRRNKVTTHPKEQDSEWIVVNGLQSLTDGSLKEILVHEERVLFCQIGDSYYAYYNRCSNCNASLDSGKLDGTTLSCISCGRQFDVRQAGRCMDASGLFLEPIPLLVEDSKVKVALLTKTKDDLPQAALSTHVR